MAQNSCPEQTDIRLAGMSTADLRQRLHDELFGRSIPFWSEHGFDRQHGGFLCGLDYDGTVRNDTKFLWFQGRGIWVYSFLFNHFGKRAEYLEVACKTVEFLLRNAVQPDGWWAELLAREGAALQPYRGDVYGMYFVAEGLQEYAWASGDERALETALDLLRRLTRLLDDRTFVFPGAARPGLRPQGLWMVNLRLGTQMLRRWRDSEIAALVDRALEAITERHYNPAIGLNTEWLDFDFSRPAEEACKCLVGHSIESYWMAMDEADRRGDARLWEVCAGRVLRHLEVGWDRVYGGLVQWVNVDQGGYEWPLERPVGTNLEFRSVGEYLYMKPLWALNEALVATLLVFERTRAEWAGRYFEMAHNLIEEKFSQRKYGLPGYMLFADRKMTRQPQVSRQDNYHPPRQLMLNILTLDRMAGGRG